MFKAFVPKITLPAGRSDIRKGGGIGIICNGQTMLFDGFEGGEPTNGMKAWLAENGVSTVDIAVLSHIHYDHYNGLLQIEDDSRFHIKQVLMYDPLTLQHGCDGSANGRAVKDDMNRAYKFIRAMQANGTKVNWIDKGGTVRCGDTSWKVYRNQPKEFTDLDDGNAYAFVNDGSLVLWSPETHLMFGGDGCQYLKYAISYFDATISGFYVQHHGNDCPLSDAQAAKNAGAVVAWETNVERNGAGTTDFTQYGARRVKQVGIPVWMQDENIYITAEYGRITFRQGSKTVSKSIPYQGISEGWGKDEKGWFYIKDGKRLTGWHKIKWSKGTDWFLFSPDGVMLTGWQQAEWSGGKSWFFFDKTSGAMLTGWHKLPWGDKKEDEFYFDLKNGNVLYGWQYLKKGDKSGWFYFDAKNANMHTGWVFVDKFWYFLADDGFMQTGWLNRNGLFYLEPLSNHNQGHAYRNQTAVIDGKTWRFDDSCYATEVKTTSGDITKVSGKLNDISATRRQFVIDIGNYVRKYAPQYGISVYSPIIAQAIHESGWGESKLASKYHNYFGMKCGTAWKGRSVNMSTQEEYSAGSLTTISANFRAYDSMEEGVKGYFDFIQLPRYSNLKGVTSPRQYLTNIKNDGYATGSNYVDHIMNTLNLYNLTQFDVAVATPTEPTKTTDANPVDMMIKIMDAELGYHEGANNKNKYGDLLHSIQPSNMDINSPWCDAYFDYCVLMLCRAFGYDADMAREVLCGDFDDYTYSSVNLYKKHGRWFSDPIKGDQIFFGGAGHTGGVVDVKNGYVYTDEGNKSDQVKRCSYKLGDKNIIGYGRPRYELLGGTLTASAMPLVKKGSTGWAVVELQKRLNAISYAGKITLDVDGSFGNNTYNMVKAYQKDRGLTPVDGECGKITWTSLFNEV